MKKIKLGSIITLCLVLFFNLANASTIITRNTTVGGTISTNDVKFGLETKSYTSDLQQQTFSTTIITSKGLGSVNSITITLDGVSVTHSFFVSTSTASGAVLTTFTAPEFDFLTYGYGVVVYYNNVGALNYTVTKYSKP